MPALARIAFGLNRSVRGDAATTASTAAPSALRSTAPRLPGFSTPSTTATNGSAGSASPDELERRDAHDRDEALGAVAEGELGEDRLARRLDRDRATAQAIERCARIGPGQQRLADEDLGELGAGVDRPPDLARAVDQRQAGRDRARAGRAGPPRP